jgi:hypothetical protein
MTPIQLLQTSHYVAVNHLGGQPDLHPRRRNLRPGIDDPRRNREVYPRFSPVSAPIGGGTPKTSQPSPTPSTPDPARPSAGALPPKPSTNTYTRYNKPVLRGPIEFAQYTSIAFAETLVLEGIAASIGSVGDAYDKGLAS